MTVHRVLGEAHLEASYRGGVYVDSGQIEVRYAVRWRGPAVVKEPGPIVAQIAAHPGVSTVRWEVEPEGA